MSKFPDIAGAAAAVLLLLAAAPAGAQDAKAGEKVFVKCKACHAVGPGAKHRVGPELNDLIGRVAGSVEGYTYSPAMAKAGQGGLTWTAETLGGYLAKPKAVVPGTKMSFAGLKKPEEIANLIAYLETFSAAAPAGKGAQAPAPSAAPAAAASAAPAPAPVAPSAPAADVVGAGQVLGLGRKATDDEIAAWDIDVRPDGLGLPKGRGTAAQGAEIFDAQCATCHGGFGEGAGRWPVLAGGQGTLKADRPEKTIGSYWPFLSTVYDYVRRAMPFGNARSLSDDEVYALTAYLLYLNDVVTDEDFELSDQNFTSVELPNQPNFVDDDRALEAHYKADAKPCMTGCRAGKAQITAHAAVLDVTPEGDGDEQPASDIQ